MRHTCILGMAVAALIVLGACGDDDDNDASGTTTNEPSTTTTARPMAEATTTTSRPDLDDLRDDLADPAIVGSEACLRVAETVREAGDGTPPELFASNIEIAAGAATQYGHDELAADLTAVALDLRVYGYTGPSARMLAEIQLDCGVG